jgi:hypothetical protein
MVTEHSIDQESQKIVAWLSPLNFWVKQDDTLSRKQEGTGQWLFEHPAFKGWLDGTDRTLWCPGMRMLVRLQYAVFLNPLLILMPAGAGKTVLTYAQCLMELSLNHDN